MDTFHNTETKSYHYQKINSLEDVTSFLKEKNTNKFTKVNKSDIDRILKVLETQEEEKAALVAELNTLKQKTVESQENNLFAIKAQKVGKAFVDRFTIFMVLWNTFTSIFKEYNIDIDGGLNGSFIRQFFELPFSIAEQFKEEGFGNPIGHDIDIILATESLLSHSVEIVIKDVLTKTMKKYQEYINYSLINPELIKPIIIANKKLIQVSDVTIKSKDIKQNDPVGKKVLQDIPHYVLKFMDNIDKTIFEVDVMAFKPISRDGWNNCDFNVNSCLLNQYGLITKDKFNGFLDIISSIKNKEATCVIDFEMLNQNATRIGIFRDEKVPYHMQMAWMLNNRFKILNVGYNSIVSESKIIDYSIANTEECIITGCKPPYYNINLNCGHQISLMSYIGIIEDSRFDSSEAIRCPLCRENLSVNLVNKLPQAPEKIQMTDISTVLNSKIEDCKLEEKEERCIISKDSEEYIRELINKKPSQPQSLPILSPSFNDPNSSRAIGRGRSSWDTS